MPPSAFPRRSAMSESATDGDVSPWSTFPEWVLLDKLGHIGRCNDATTAWSTTNGHGPIQVSFVVANPPALSRCVVHCPGLTGDDSGTLPRVIGADGAFLLIRVSFRDPDDGYLVTEVFLYRAGPGTPSLYLLPEPYPAGIFSLHVGVLSCGDHCLVVVPEGRFMEASGRVGYDLHIFSTKTKLWSTKVAKMACDIDSCYLEFQHSKVFTVGGDSLAWVDLRHGILMCEGIREDRVMRLIQLPELMPINEKMNFKVNCDGSKPPLDMIRDVIFCDGSFRFIEMEPHYLDSRSKATQLRWSINIFEREILSDNWEPCTSVESANISPADSGFLYLFSEIWDYKESKLTLNKVICSAPTLNLYEDDVVYMISRMKDEDKNGWVFVINTEIMKLERVVPFAAESLYDPRTFLQCDFSNYLSKATGMPATNSWMEKFNKEDQLPLMLYVCSILIGQCQLRNFAKRLTHKRPSYLEIWSLFHSGVASTMNVHIQELAQFANSNGQGKAASDSLNIFMRVSKEIEKLLAGNSFDDPCTSCEAIREKIDVAVGALDRLLHVVPSEVLDTWRGVISAACLDDESVDEWGIAEKFHAELTV